MKHTLLCFFLIGIGFSTSAQDYFRGFKGRVVDSANLKPLPDATISIFRAKDTMLLNFGFTTPNGNFSINVKSKDSLLIVVSLLGFYEHSIQEAATDRNWDFRDYRDIKLNPLPIELKGFTMKSAAIRMNGDTIEINANRFKVLPGSDVAQLFKKIPGFEVSVKGEIKVNGANVNKIMVDGSDFFGNNPGMVSKNLTADMIETVQVFEERNVDGSPKEEASQIINLKLKKGKRNGTFGDVLAGYGTESRYESGLRLNNFKNDRKISFVFNSNNINETGFDFGFDNWHNANFVDRNGSNNNNFWYSGGSNGRGNINRKTGAGLTYFNEFAGKQKLSMQLFINRNDYSSISASKRINALNDTSSRINADSTNTSGLVYSGTYEINYTNEIDSTGYYDIGVNGSLSDNSSSTKSVNAIRLNETLLLGGLSEVKNLNFSNHVTVNSSYRRTLRKNKRYIFSVSGNYKMNTDRDHSFQFLNNNSDTFNNRNERVVKSHEFLAKVYGGLPISKYFNFNLSIDRWQQINQTEQVTQSAENRFQNIFEQNYTDQIDSLSVRYSNIQIQNSIHPYFSYRGKKFYAHAGITYLQLSLQNKNESGSVLDPKTYPAWLPTMGLSYYSGKMYFSFNASKSVDFPQISELMPVLNLANNYERMSGNENLAPQEKYSARIYSSLYKLKGFRYFYLGGRVNFSDNAKIWVNKQGSDGIIVKTPENATGQADYNSWLNLSKKLYKIAHFTFGHYQNYEKNPLIINGSKSFGISNSQTLSPGFNFTYADSLEFSFGGSWSYTDFRNTLNKNLNFSQNVYSYSAEVRAVLKTGTEINTAINISDQRNVPGIGQLIPLWNAYIQHPLSKKNSFFVKLSAYDILNKNTNISRQQSNNFIYISQNNRLQQYFMLTLLYKVKKMGGESDIDFVY